MFTNKKKVFSHVLSGQCPKCVIFLIQPVRAEHLCWTHRSKLTFFIHFHHSFASVLDRDVLEDVKLQQSYFMCDWLRWHHKSAERHHHRVPVRWIFFSFFCFATSGHRQSWTRMTSITLSWRRTPLTANNGSVVDASESIDTENYRNEKKIDSQN